MYKLTYIIYIAQIFNWQAYLKLETEGQRSNKSQDILGKNAKYRVKNY